MRFVIKMGGELLAPKNRAESEAIAADIAALSVRGDRVLLVHGGGPQTTALQKQLGQEPKIVGGRRITDEDGLEAIKMVVGGKLNIDFCALLGRCGVQPVGLTGASSGAIRAVKRPPRLVSGGGDLPVDFGQVGDVVGFNLDLLGRLLDSGYVPVLACIGADDRGGVYNINADVVANDLALSFEADGLVLVTGTPGVLADVSDPTSRIRCLTVDEARGAIADGTVSGGMIPKLEESIRAIEAGVNRISILGRLGSGDLLRALDLPGSVGTTLTR